MLPFSLAVIVLIFAVWQEITLSPEKEKLNRAFEYYNRLKAEEQNLLQKPMAHEKKKYYLANGAHIIKMEAAPKFPR